MANPVRTTENSGSETDGYTVINDEDGIGEVLYHVSPQANGEAEVIRYGPSADGVGDASEEDKLPQRVPPEVANEILDLGFTQITVGETVMATEDPADPAVGDEWYRTDLGVLRRQTPQGVAEVRDFYRPGEDYEYTDYGIAPVTVLEEGFEDTDPVSDADWSITNETVNADEDMISVVTEEKSKGGKSLAVSGSPAAVYAAYTALDLTTKNKITLEFDALSKPAITFRGNQDLNGFDLEINTESISVSDAGGTESVVSDGESLDLLLGSVTGDGWISYTLEVTTDTLTITAEGNGNTVSDSVALTGSFPVDEIHFGAGGDSGTTYIDSILLETTDLPDGTRLSPQITEEDIAPDVDLGGGLSEDSVGVAELDTQAGPEGNLEAFLAPSLALQVSSVGGELRPSSSAIPSPSNLPSGKGTIYISDGNGFGAQGDLIYAVNDGGTVKATKLAEVANMSAP